MSDLVDGQPSAHRQTGQMLLMGPVAKWDQRKPDAQW